MLAASSNLFYTPGLSAELTTIIESIDRYRIDSKTFDTDAMAQIVAFNQLTPNLDYWEAVDMNFTGTWSNVTYGSTSRYYVHQGCTLSSFPEVTGTSNAYDIRFNDSPNIPKTLPTSWHLLQRLRYLRMADCSFTSAEVNSFVTQMIALIDAGAGSTYGTTIRWYLNGTDTNYANAPFTGSVPAGWVTNGSGTSYRLQNSTTGARIYINS